MSLHKNINKHLKIVSRKKNYNKVLNKQTYYINKKKLLKNNINYKYYFIKFIIKISTNKSNVFLHIMNSYGKEQFFYSIKQKNLNNKILEHFYKILMLKSKFLKNKPIAMHFDTTQLNHKWFLQKITKKLFLVIVQFYNKYAHNGCRKKKLKRKK